MQYAKRESPNVGNYSTDQPRRLHRPVAVGHSHDFCNRFLGGEWAREQGADIVRYPPNWQRYGKLAERLRNHFMLLDSRPDVVIALPGGEDTEELLAPARAAGLQTLSVSMSTW